MVLICMQAQLNTLQMLAIRNSGPGWFGLVATAAMHICQGWDPASQGPQSLEGPHHCIVTPMLSVSPSFLMTGCEGLHRRGGRWDPHGFRVWGICIWGGVGWPGSRIQAVRCSCTRVGRVGEPGRVVGPSSLTHLVCVDLIQVGLKGQGGV